MPNCLSCGSETVPDANFCGRCGVKLKAVAACRCGAGPESIDAAGFCEECGVRQIDAALLVVVENTAKKTLRTAVDDDLTRLGHSLQTARQRQDQSVPQNGLFFRPLLVADHRDAGSDPRAKLDRCAKFGAQLCCQLPKRQSRAHRIFSVLFARVRVAEIGNQTVACTAGYITVVPLDDVCAAPIARLIGWQKILDIWIRGEPRKLTRHDGERAALARVE